MSNTIPPEDIKILLTTGSGDKIEIEGYEEPTFSQTILDQEWWKMVDNALLDGSEDKLERGRDES